MTGKKGEILFILLLIGCLLLFTSWSSSLSDKLVGQEVPGYQAKTFGQSVLFYSVFTTLGLAFWGAIYICAKLISSFLKSRRQRKIAETLRRSEAYLPLFKKS